MKDGLHIFSFHIKSNTDTATTIGKVIAVSETLEDARDYARKHVGLHYDSDGLDISEDSYLWPHIIPVGEAVVISYITESEDIQ